MIARMSSGQNLTDRMVLVTGCAGFIGYHVANRLLASGFSVVGIDNLNSYYDVGLKKARLERLEKWPNFSFVFASLEDQEPVLEAFHHFRPQTVINLAAQAGVRYSLTAPRAYVNSNVLGFLNVLEGCREQGVNHLIYASSSSVYGANTKKPFSVHDGANHPLSLYAATKKTNELMAHAYSHLFGLPTTGLRFFTVYGPWGRPDMALFLFTKAIIDGSPIKVFNHGRMKRDFTYIDDVVEGVIRLVGLRPEPSLQWDSTHPDPGSSYAPYRVYNIGNGHPVDLMMFIETLESTLGKKAIKEYLPLQAGDVTETYSDCEELFAAVEFRPRTSVEQGVARFVEWYKDFYKVE